MRVDYKKVYSPFNVVHTSLQTDETDKQSRCLRAKEWSSNRSLKLSLFNQNWFLKARDLVSLGSKFSEWRIQSRKFSRLFLPEKETGTKPILSNRLSIESKL